MHAVRTTRKENLEESGWGPYTPGGEAAGIRLTRGTIPYAPAGGALAYILQSYTTSVRLTEFFRDTGKKSAERMLGGQSALL